MDELKTSQEWCEELGAQVMDPDGWRHDHKNWDDLISREEFDQRYLRSTVRLDLYLPPGVEYLRHPEGGPYNKDYYRWETRNG